MSATFIAIAAHKGGTGKTCTALCLSSALARFSKRCLVVDVDAQGHSTLGVGLEVEEDGLSLSNLFAEPRVPLPKLVRETSVPGLSIVPSDIRLEWTARSLHNRPGYRPELLLNALAPHRNDFDFVLMDCPPSLGIMPEQAVAAADLILIPLLLEARAKDALEDLLKFIHLIRGEDFDRWRILLTRIDIRNTVGNRLVQNALQEQWKDRILSTTIPKNETLNHAQIARTDIYSYDPKCPGAVAYQALAQELLTHA